MVGFIDRNAATVSSALRRATPIKKTPYIIQIANVHSMSGVPDYVTGSRF